MEYGSTCVVDGLLEVFLGCGIKILPVWTQAQRRSGINAPYMRLSEMYLGYAEACAATGDNAEAKTYLTKVRNRAFRTADEANVEGFINKEGSLLKAIIDERGFEFAGEARAIKYAADNGAVILQCSWGYNSSESSIINGYTPGPATEKEWAEVPYR